MSTAEEGAAYRLNTNRLRASVACQTCRRRKIKCNVQSLKPGDPCKVCKSSGAECVVIYDDNRKFNAPKKYVRQLEERVQSLELLLRSTSGIDPVEVSRSRNAQDSTMSPPLTSHPQPLQLASPKDDIVPRAPGNTQNPPELEPPTDPPRAMSDQSAYSTSGALIEAPGGHEFVNGLTPIPEIPLADLSSPLSDNVSFGGNIENTLNPSELDSRSKTQNFHTAAHTLPLNLWNHDIVDERHPQLASPLSFDHGHLVFPDTHVSSTSQWQRIAPTDHCAPDTFNETHEFRLKYLNKWWSFQDMNIRMVEPKLFMDGYTDAVRSEHYSTFTLHAMMACALRLDKDESVRSLSGIFAERAKKEVARELESPNMSTIHGLCLLSDYECTNGSENVGWIYVGIYILLTLGAFLTGSGIACRLLLDLGLHQDCAHRAHTDRSSPVDIVARQRITFGCYVYEQVWSLLLGLPSSINVLNLDFSLLPSDYSDCQIQLLAAWVDLSSLMAEMVALFSRSKSDHETTRKQLKCLDEAFQILETSFRSRWTEEDQMSWPPSICALYMQFYNAQILYHKTITANRRRFWPDRDSEDTNDLPPYTLEMSQRIMYDNAVKIAQILELRRRAFEERGFALLMLDIIFTATSTLITSMASFQGDQSSALKDYKWLICFIEACESLKDHYPVVNRMVTVLNSLLESTGLIRFIWRGTPTVPAISNPLVTIPPSSDSASTGPDRQGRRAVPFNLKRWCQDDDPVAASASWCQQSHAHARDATLNMSEAQVESPTFGSLAGDAVYRWDHLGILSPWG